MDKTAKKIHQLRFRAKDRDTFEAIKEGRKKIETRAATDKFRKIKAGDIAVFVCAGRRFKKEISRVEIFKTIPALFKKYPLKIVNPFVKGIDEARDVYYSYPGYQEKIKKFGLIAMEFN